jgi:hypothetical protein
MTESDALRILHLPSGCSAADVRQAYLDLAKVWHPDRFHDDARLRERAELQLTEINEAYAILRSGAPQSRPDSQTPPDGAGAAEQPPPEPVAPSATPSPDSPAPNAQFSPVKTIVMGVGLGLVIAAVVTVVMMTARGTQNTSTDAPAVPEASGSRAGAEQVGAASRRRPTSGTELLAASRSGGGSLVVTNESGRDAVVALATDAGHERAVYVRAGEQVTLVNVAAGTYRVQIMVGRDWGGDRFTREVDYQELEQPVQFVENADRNTTEYTKLTVSLQPTVAGMSGIRSTAPFRIAPK